MTGVDSVSGCGRATISTLPPASDPRGAATVLVSMLDMSGVSLWERGGSAAPDGGASAGAEGLLEPLRADRRIHLHVEDQRSVGGDQPLLDDGQVLGAPDGGGLRAGGAGDRGEVGVGEADERYVVAHRREVVDL